MSELAERSGVSAGTIRYYLREGMLGDAPPPAARAGAAASASPSGRDAGS